MAGRGWALPPGKHWLEVLLRRPDLYSAEAKSAITFALPLSRKFIRPFLAKEDRLSHERDNLQVNLLATGLAAHIAKHLEQKGSLPRGGLQRVLPG